MLCVNRAGKSGCNGDSGGPLFVYDETGATPPVQVGVVSWGSSACINTPSVFARVSEEIGWINGYINLWSPTNPPVPAPVGTPSPVSQSAVQEALDFVNEAIVELEKLV